MAMHKRYHHAPHHAIHHSRIDDGPYASEDTRRTLEHHDASMISEDHSKMANLPQEVVMKPWEDHEAYLPEVLDDTIRGINKQVNYDDSQRKAHFMPKKV